MQNRKYSLPLRLDRPRDYDLHNGMEMTDPYGIRPPTCLWTMNLYPKAIIFFFIARIKCLILVFVCKVIPVVSSFQHISFYSYTSAGLCKYFSIIRVYSSNHLIHVSRIVLLILPRCSLNTCNYLLIWVYLYILIVHFATLTLGQVTDLQYSSIKYGRAYSSLFCFLDDFNTYLLSFLACCLISKSRSSVNIAKLYDSDTPLSGVKSINHLIYMYFYLPVLKIFYTPLSINSTFTCLIIYYTALAAWKLLHLIDFWFTCNVLLKIHLPVSNATYFTLKYTILENISIVITKYSVTLDVHLPFNFYPSFFGCAPYIKTFATPMFRITPWYTFLKNYTTVIVRYLLTLRFQ